MSEMEKIVALDIGTRSVVGMVMEKIEGTFKLVDITSVEHGERSMLDGQIHDILSVSNTITAVKEQLEKKHGPIEKVCVAAAGRALKTQQTLVKKSIKNQPLINEEDILHLELSAVQQAQMELAETLENDKSTNYYCAGYSVLQYKLDGSEIGSLIDQKGEVAEVEVIATFLPKVVVESLISALQRSNLEMDALTLEPIAAINVLIPPSMRRLNVALVDIGAGTSDIAITNYGTIIGYGMVPVAGDEITDAISQHYLLDFPVAESVKREITKSGKTKIVDILGFETEVTIDELAENIEGAIDQLANEICEEILRLNRKSPQAVMLVGGGSLTPNLTNKIAEKLKLPNNRVATRGTDAIQNLDRENVPDSPAFVTPIGIAIAAKQNPIHYISVKVNDQVIRLFDIKQLTIGDSLLISDIDIKKLYGKPGMASMVTINGETITIPGTLGQPPTLLKNGQHANLNDPIKNGDEIFVERGKDGEDPIVTVKDLIGELPSYTIFYNQKKYEITQEIFINGNRGTLDQPLHDGDSVEINSIKTVKDFLKTIGEEYIIPKLRPFTFYWNGKEIQLQQKICTMKVNNIEAPLHRTIKNEDKIEVTITDKLTLKEILEKTEIDLYEEMPVRYNNKEIILKKEITQFFRDSLKVNLDDYIYDGDALTSSEQQNGPFIFQDIFRHIDLDVNNMKGKHFKLKINGQEASFTTPLAPHDNVEIQWLESIFAK